jgi:hypothetical protein
MTAGYQKIFSPDARLGFLSHARGFADALAEGRVPAGVASADAARQIIFNDRLDAAVAAFFMIAVIVILAESAREWWSIMSGRKAAVSSEVPYEPALAMAMDRAQPVGTALACDAPTRPARVAPRAWVAAMATALRAIIGAPDWRRYAHAIRRIPQRVDTGVPLMTPAQLAEDRLTARYSRPGSRCC